MVSKKRKLHLLWLHEWQLEEYEAWFADMARKGWKLERLKLWVAVFVKSEPEEVRYRIEIAEKNKEVESDRIHLYDDAGWEYVDSRRYMYVFREKQENTGIEIHSDPLHQAETMEVLKKSIRRTGMALGTLTLLMLALLIFRFIEMTSYDLLRMDPFSTFSLVILYIPLSVMSLLGMKHISSLIKQLKRGEGLDRHKPYRRKLNRNRVAGLGILGAYIALFVFSLSLAGTFNKEGNYPPIPENTLPVVSLTDVEEVGLKQVTYQENGIARDSQNYFREEASIFFPNQYILRQQFTIPQEAHSYEPRITSRKFEGITIGMAERLVTALKEEQHTPEPFSEESLHGFDEIWVFEYQSNDFQVVARAGKAVYHIDYHGEQPAEMMKERLEEVMRSEE